MGDHIRKKKNYFFHHSMSGIMHHSLEPFSRQLFSLIDAVTLLLALHLVMAKRRTVVRHLATQVAFMEMPTSSVKL